MCGWPCPYLCSPTAELIDQIMGWRNGPLATTYQLILPSVASTLLQDTAGKKKPGGSAGAIFLSHYIAIWLRFVHQKALFATATPEIPGSPDPSRLLSLIFAQYNQHSGVSDTYRWFVVIPMWEGSKSKKWIRGKSDSKEASVFSSNLQVVLSH